MKSSSIRRVYCFRFSRSVSASHIARSAAISLSIFCLSSVLTQSAKYLSDSALPKLSPRLKSRIAESSGVFSSKISKRSLALAISPRFLRPIMYSAMILCTLLSNLTPERSKFLAYFALNRTEAKIKRLALTFLSAPSSPRTISCGSAEGRSGSLSRSRLSDS